MLRLLKTLDTPAENLALDEALLEQAEAGEQTQEVLRLWHAREPFIVIGRSSRVDVEVNRSRQTELAVPVFRRPSGGAAIVAGPGCMFYALLLSLTKRPHLRMLDEAHRFVMTHLVEALRPVVPKLEFEGTCDLVLDGRKVSGNSLRVQRQWILYHGTLLLDLDIGLVADLLNHPPREPDYRSGRSHLDFIQNLGIEASEVEHQLCEHWQATEDLDSIPWEATKRLTQEKYRSDAWNLLR